MLNTLFSSVYDFSGKRVRQNGKVLSKFDIASILDDFYPFRCYVQLLMDVMSYNELSDALLSACLKKGLSYKL